MDDKSEKHTKKAKQNKSPPPDYELGKDYCDSESKFENLEDWLKIYCGDRFQKNMFKAAYHFDRAAKINHIPSKVELGLVYEKLARYYELLMFAACSGRLYLQNTGVLYELKETVTHSSWHSHNSDHLIADALFHFLFDTETRSFNKKDSSDIQLDSDSLAKKITGAYTKAAQCYKEAAEASLEKDADPTDKQSIADANYYLSLLYAQGKGVPKDEIEEVKFLKKAADQGKVSVQYSLGLMFADGKGVEKDESQAKHYLKLAAGQGNVLAQYQLGLIYSKSPEKSVKALKYYKLAALRGNLDAQKMLGLIFSTGEQKNEHEAIKWFRLAARQGDETAISNLKKITQNRSSTADTLLDIVTEINNKIMGIEYSSRRTTDETGWKITLLKALENILKSQQDFNPNETEVLYDLCQKLYSETRNPFSLFKTHSSIEFQHWLDKKNIRIEKKIFSYSWVDLYDFTQEKDGSLENNLKLYIQKKAKLAGPQTLFEIISEVNSDYLKRYNFVSEPEPQRNLNKSCLIWGIEKLLKNNPSFNAAEKDILLALCKEIYAIRNQFSSSISSEKFTKLLEQNDIKTNTKLKLSYQKITELIKGKVEDNLLEFIKKTAQEQESTLLKGMNL